MLSLNALHFSHGPRALLAGIDLKVDAGEIVALLGPNGAGKSTLLRCINQTAGQYRGEVRLQGRDAASISRRELARLVSWVPQQGGSSMALRVVDMVLLGRAPHRRPGSGRRDLQIALDIIERLQLQHLATRAVDQLSGGERQRVMLARAIAQESSLMLLDEPTSDLDLRHQLDTMAVVRESARSRGTAVLVAIHDLALAARLADRLVLLSNGRIQADGPWQQVLTAENLRAVYGVEAIIGSDGGMPYVIPVAGTT